MEEIKEVLKMSRETLEAWAAGFKPKFSLGYSQNQLSYIVAHAQGIQKQAVQLEMIWANREVFKNDIDIAKAIADKVKEVKKSIEYLEEYLEPTKEDSK
ncbi:hypothetical protein ABE883_19170 [Enterococcus raffinosus]|uniref:hypothetical protein n=1 Tax=Enterococcus TaxID=1350 RepID=UPI0007F3420A|nr:MULTISPECIES: hypothetical protein [Enterococcus]SAM78299.1 hypothetical protein DTPHA_1405929 [Enterococcus faecium]MZJ57094.1 hypothetical protein [Enterococcus avium]MZJ77559.1 hypothetical protein [Enterococcus avium]MZJ81818.1 hypothetical protein [Enterococcus avium]MZJ88135.1 hypothetical protein [Enterococcus avium]